MFEGDTLNGQPVTADDVEVSSDNVPNGLTLNPDDVPSGTYSFVYTICEKGANPANCATAVATVIVNNPITADDDKYEVAKGGTTSSVFEGDTLNGQPVTEDDVDVSSDNVPNGLTLNPDGTVTVGDDVPSGTYSFVYTICEKGANPANCATAVATVIVNNPITADDDKYEVAKGGTTSSVFEGDTLNGQPVTADDVDVSSDNVPNGLTLNPDGTVTVGDDVPSGTYSFVYTICEKGANPANCATAVATVIVKDPGIVVSDDEATTDINTEVTIPVR